MRIFVQTDLGQAEYMSALRIFLQSLGRACTISQQSDHAQETTPRARKRRKTQQQTSSRILELCPQGSQQTIAPTADTEVTASTRQYTATLQNVDVAHDHVHRAVSNQGSTTPTATRSLPPASLAQSGRDISYGSIIEELGLEADLSSVPAHLCEMQRLAGNHDLQKEWWSADISFMNSFKHGTAIYIATEIDCRRSRHKSQDVLLTHILADIVEQEVANEKDENTSGPLPHGKTVRSVVIDRVFDKFSKDNSSNPAISLTRKKVVALIREGQRLMRLAPGLLFCLSSLSKAVYVHFALSLKDADRCSSLQKLSFEKIDQLNKELEKHKVLQQYLGLADIQKELQASYHTILNEKKSEAQRHEFPRTSPCLAESLEVASTHRAQMSSHDLDLIQQITDHVRLSRMFTFLQPVHIETVIPLLRGAGGLVRRWNSGGEVVQANPIDDGIATDVVQLLENQGRYDTAVDLWRSRRGIRLSDEEQVDELESYKQILLLVGRIFPVDQNLHVG